MFLQGRQAIHCAVAAGMETVCEVLLSSSRLKETGSEREKDDEVKTTEIS